MSEQSIASARASVMIYDEPNRRWIPSGSSSGLSKVHIYHHVVNNSFRVVGRKLHDQEVVINCSILKGLRYNQATATFHQWRDNRQVYGLNFSGRDDAEAFAFAMMHAVEALNNNAAGPLNMNPAGIQPDQQQQPPQQLPPQPQPHNHHEEDMGYRTMTREDIAMIQERRMSQPQQQPVVMPSLSSPNTTPVVIPGPSPGQHPHPGHNRTNSAPQPPPPPMPATVVPVVMNGGSVPVPPPPPMPNGPLSRGGDGDTGSLAAALANAHLRKANRIQQPDAISTTSTSSSSSSGSTSSGSIYGTLRGNRTGTNGNAVDTTAAGGQSGTSLMDEMAKTLARRRAMVKENSAPNVPALQNNSNSHNSQDEDESSKPQLKKDPPSSPKMNQRKRTGSDTSSGIVVNGNGTGYDSDLDALKQDILKEVRKELYKIKAEIIDAIKIELNRR